MMFFLISWLEMATFVDVGSIFVYFFFGRAFEGKLIAMREFAALLR